jgi:hypothetical protein
MGREDKLTRLFPGDERQELWRFRTTTRDQELTRNYQLTLRSVELAGVIGETFNHDADVTEE